MYRDSVRQTRTEKHLDSLEKVYYSQPNYLKVIVCKNDREINHFKKIRVRLFSNNKEIKRVDTTNKFLFPKLGDNDSIVVKISYGKETHIFSGYFGKQINRGGEFIIGTITNFDKMTSIAVEQDMDKNRADYKTYSSRFNIPHDYSIDVPEFNKIKKLKYIIFRPRTYGDGTYILTIEDIKKKN
jgi:hypothetical protein